MAFRDETGHDQETSKVGFFAASPVSKKLSPFLPLRKSTHCALPAYKLPPCLGHSHPNTQLFSSAITPPQHTHTHSHTPTHMNTNTHSLTYTNKVGRPEQSPIPASRSMRGAGGGGDAHSQIKGFWPKSLSGQRVKSAADENSTVFSHSPTEPVFPVQSLPTDD